MKRKKRDDVLTSRYSEGRGHHYNKVTIEIQDWQRSIQDCYRQMDPSQ